MRFKDITGQKFGRLTAQWPVGKDKSGNVHWLCLCECGVLPVVERSNLGRTTSSCGCLQRELAAEAARKITYRGKANFKHGHAPTSGETREYNSWCNMRARCTRPDATGFSYYGGRGITVCDRWIDSFENFLADMGPRPEGTTLGRFGDVGDYEPSNVKWMTPKEQYANRRPRN